MRVIGWLVIVFGWMCMVYGQELAVSRAYPFKHYGSAEGLSQSAVNGIIQDNQGYIWLTTQEGINRFDGYGFRKFYRNNEQTRTGLTNDNFTAITLDDAGQLWTGTGQGLFVFNAEHELFDPILLPVEGMQPFINAISSNGPLLAIATSQGLFIWHRVQQQFINIEELPIHLRAGNVPHLAALGDGFVTIDEDVALWHIGPVSTSAVMQFSATLLPAVAQLNFVYHRRNGDVLLFSSKGIAQLTAERKVVPIFSAVASFPAVRGVGETDTGLLWLATENGLFNFDDVSLKLVKAQDYRTSLKGIKGSSLLNCFVDSSGLVWVGTHHNGVAVYDPSSDWLDTLSGLSKTPSSFNQSSISALYSENERMLWIGGAEGAARLNLASGELHTIASELLPDDWVTVIHQDSKGQFWFGFHDGPLGIWDPYQNLFMALPNFPIVQATSLVERQEFLYLATRNDGVWRVHLPSLKVEQWRKDSGPNGWPTNRIQSLFVDSQGELWIGTFDSGLLRYDERTHAVQRYDVNTVGLTDNLVLSVREHQPGLLWVGTKAGLNLFNVASATVQRFGRPQGLSNETIYDVLSDGKQYWIPTNDGVFRFDFQSQRFLRYGSDDGLPNDEFNANAFARSPAGVLFFGGISGVAIVKPWLLNPANEPAPTQLSAVSLYGQPLPLVSWQTASAARPVELSFEQNVLQFALTTLQFNGQERLRFFYQLAGSDARWLANDIGDNRIDLIHLAPGEYHLNAYAENLNGLRGAPLQLHFVIKPSLWRSPMAFTGYVAIVALVIFIIAWQVRQKRQIQKASFLAVRKREEQLNLALRGSGDEMWDWDMVNDHIERLNPSGKLAFPTEVDWHGLNSFSDYIHPDDIAQIQQAIAAHLCGDTPYYQATYRIRAVDGSWLWVADHGQVTKVEHGKPQRMSGVIRNIDALKTAQMALLELNSSLEQKVAQRTLDLQQANTDLTSMIDQLHVARGQLVEAEKMASLGAMVAGISHEVNTPLGIALTAMSFLLEQGQQLFDKLQQGTMTKSDFTQFQKEFLSSVQLALTNLNRAAELVRSFKQVSVDQSAEDLRYVDLKQVLQDSLNTLKPKFKNTDYLLKLTCADDLQVQTYPGAVSQIVINLVMNSLTHGFKERNNGEIHLTVYSDLTDPDEVLMIYKDDGVGMTEDAVKKVFEPFFTTNRSAGSTGLGMHICYNLVSQKLMGQIICNSAPGQGVEFYIRFPKILTLS